MNSTAWRWRVPRLRKLLPPPNRLLLDPWVTREAAQLTGLVLNVGSGEDLRQFGVRTILLDAHAPGVSVRADLATSLPFVDAAFDGALCTEVLEHIPDDRLVLRELARVLKPGARLIVTVPFMYRYHPDPVDFRRYTPYGLRDTLTREGFTVDTAAGLGGPVMALLLWLDALHLVVRLPLRALLILVRLPLAAMAGGDIRWSSYAANAVAVAHRR